MYLSYSGFAKFEQCPLAYYYDYIQKVKAEGPDDRLGSVFGSAVGKVFEDFYTQEIWRRDQPVEVLTASVGPTVDQIIKQETSPRYDRPGGVLLWKGDGPGQNSRALYVNRDELVADVRDAVERGVATIRKHRFLGRKNGAEVKLDQMVRGHKLGGRADFIIERIKPHNDLIILDGKGSKHRDRYISPKQLMWYAILFRHQFQRLPDKLGFVFWKFSPEEAVDWVDFSEASIDELLENILDDISAIESTRGAFRSNPCNESCRFCPYATDELCPKGKGIVAEIERKRAEAEAKKARNAVAGVVKGR